MTGYEAQRVNKGISVGGSFFNLNKYELQGMLKELEEEKKTLPDRIAKVKAALNLIKEEERGATERVHNLAYELYLDTNDDDEYISRDKFDQHWDYKSFIAIAKSAIKNLGAC